MMAESWRIGLAQEAGLSAARQLLGRTQHPVRADLGPALRARCASASNGAETQEAE
jgi:hypothetical protein